VIDTKMLRQKNQRPLLWLLVATLLLGLQFSLSATASQDKPNILIGLDAEFGHKTSTSAQAVRQGMEIAIDEINQRGGLLGGRKLELVLTDNRSIPAVGVDNLRELAARPELVGVFGAKFSPVVMQWLPVAHELGLPIFATWSSADPITEPGFQPSYVFRLSLKDAWAAPVLLRFAKEERQATRVGLILPNTSWGRSNQAALQKTAQRMGVDIRGERWYNWGDKSLLEIYQELQQAGAQAIIFIGNEAEGTVLLKDLATLPKAARLPIVSHWGVTGGAFFEMAGKELAEVDFSVIQTYSFIGARSPVAQRVLAALKSRYGIEHPEQVKSPVGVAHAYDLTHLLGRAIQQAGTTQRSKVRDALEKLGPYDGLVRRYSKPFTADRHDALTAEQAFMARYDQQGALLPIPWSKK
jgi:branched-chain amino acid transport system substrate-binding protein